MFIEKECFHPVIMHSDLMTEYLSPAKEHLYKMIDQDGLKYCGTKLGRLMQLTRERHEDVEDTLFETIFSADNNGSLITALDVYGRYMETQNRKDIARRAYRAAIAQAKDSSGSWNSSLMAHNGLRSLNAQSVKKGSQRYFKRS